MANHKSALKKIKQDKIRQMRNKAYKTRLKNVVKNVETALSDANKEAAQAALQEAISTLDRVASKGVIHKNKAARKKSRLTKKVNALLAA
ncbi:30S ribosomal protein S20 [candidate division KSB3 bacterium]|uniref:Small ribosomal subunit protein bS20 n=1 Tax=candidate division KSB3 bacterium TaxID=2044937 RepID=A0A2G6E1S7_9BACT|nr:MAG: 30S ribosomal protein S20 [candidate division KSB3 bacterium]PIE28638.1 MAG: 30S ribosomal protein S20 [candidate division KSB3 bacterium]